MFLFDAPTASNSSGIEALLIALEGSRLYHWLPPTQAPISRDEVHSICLLFFLTQKMTANYEYVKDCTVASIH
jgi:hypothetical protein